MDLGVHPTDPESNLSLAAFVSQSDWFVDEIVGGAFTRFGRYSNRKYPNFQSVVEGADPQMLRLVVASLYNQTRVECTRRGIRYEYERSFDPRSGRQRVLRVEEMVHGRNGTCLDWALLGASVLAQVKLLPLLSVLVLPHGVHAVVAVHLTQPRIDRPASTRIGALLKDIERGRALPLDFTGLASMTSGSEGRCTFARASSNALEGIRAAVRREEALDAAVKSSVVDVWRAWELGHRGFARREVRSLRRALSPPDYSSHISSLLEDSWAEEALLDQIGRWLVRPDESQVFWICGDPGVGKSTIAAQVCLTLREHVAAHHFCAYDDAAHSDARGLASSIAFQLSERLPGYHAWLIRQDIGKLLNQEPARFLSEVLLAGVRQASPTAGWWWLIVIDALDEVHDGENDVAEFIGRVVMRHQLPPSLKVLVTSRPEPAVVRAMAGIRPVHLRVADPVNKQDIRTYLTRTLFGRVPEQAVELVVDRSGGNFLYARSTAEATVHDSMLESPPDGLVGWQRSCISRRFHRDYVSVVSRPS